MCLTIKYVPTSEKAANCIRCHKKYSKWPRWPITPFMNTRIPKSGILNVKKPETEIYQNKEIHGGAIHACTGKFQSHYFFAQEKSFAFGVIAYGMHRDLACTLLYIPNLDYTQKREKRLAQIKKWQRQKEGPSNEEVKALFPNFVPPKR